MRTPQRPQAASQGRAAVSEEPFWQEALTYTREHFLQRDVELQVWTPHLLLSVVKGLKFKSSLASARSLEKCKRRCIEFSEMELMCLQISGVDRGGCFLGTLTLKGGQNLNMGIALLSQGLAKLQVNFDPVREQQGRELVSTEKEAKDKRLKASTSNANRPRSIAELHAFTSMMTVLCIAPNVPLALCMKSSGC